jgi:hypothetical protein
VDLPNCNRNADHDGIRPAELLERARSQLKPYDTISTVRSSVIGIKKDDQLFAVEFKTRDIVRTRTVVVAGCTAISGVKELFGAAPAR